MPNNPDINSEEFKRLSQGDTLYYPSDPGFNDPENVRRRHSDLKAQLDREQKMQGWAPYLGGAFETARQFMPINLGIFQAPTALLENYIRASGSNKRFVNRPTVGDMNAKSIKSSGGLRALIPSKEGTANMNAHRGAARGVALSVPWTLTFNASIPYYLQRLAEMAVAREKYKDYNGFWNKWDASKELAEDGVAKRLYNWAGKGYDLANKALDATKALKYDDWYKEAAGGWGPTLAEAAGFSLFNAATVAPGLGEALYRGLGNVRGGKYMQRALPFIFRYNPTKLPDSVPALFSTVLSPAVNKIPVVGKPIANGMNGFSKAWWGLRPVLAYSYRTKKEYDAKQRQKQQQPVINAPQPPPNTPIQPTQQQAPNAWNQQPTQQPIQQQPTQTWPNNSWNETK